MDNLIENYNSKCQTISSIPDNMWKKGVIITFILFSLVYFATHRMIMCILSFTILFVVWFYICEFVYNRELKRKVGNICEKSNVKGKNKYSEYEQILDKYQKNYISNYVRKNKLSKSGKLNIIINELQQEINRKEEIKNIFVIPSILTLSTSIINYDSNLSLLIFIIQYGITILSAIIIITAFYKLYDCTTFNKYSGIRRLKELLIHTAIKHGR